MTPPRVPSLDAPRLPVLLLVVLIVPLPPPASAGDRVLGLAEIHRLDRLPVFRESMRVASVSSYDRSGGNDDGFSGKYSAVREEPGGIVIADIEGPGIVYRFWTPTPTDDTVEFFFDGEAEPRMEIPFREIFLGKRHPFLNPLVGHGVGGFFSYLPLPFAERIKIRIRAKRVQFYQIQYAVYPDASSVKSFDPRLPGDGAAQLERARAVLSSSGTDLSERAAPPGAPLETHRRSVRLEPGKSSVLHEDKKGGRIVGLRLSPASALGGKARDRVLRIAFDGGAPAILCPAGDFFGHAWGRPAMTSLLVGTVGETCYSYLPMPYDRSVRAELVSGAKAGPAVDLTVEVVTARVPRGPDEGRLYAVWRRENPTTAGKPFTFLQTEGRGHIVGCVLQCQGFESGKTLYFEGDDRTTIDGELVIHGTGSEDFFNGGWYDVPDRWEKRLSFPLSGCLGYQKHLGRTGGYRFFLGDALAYRESILQTIEHGGTNNSVPADYCAVTYFYAESTPEQSVILPPVEERRVVDLDRLVFPAWWQIPIHGFTFQGARLERGNEKIAGEDVRFLSMRAEGQDWFGPPFLSLTCEVPAAGSYEISLDAVRGPGQGQVQLFENEVPVGQVVDLYGEERAKAPRLRLGARRLVEGNNNVMLKVVGKNEKSTGLALDLIELKLERVE